jgi:hypothetical protein
VAEKEPLRFSSWLQVESALEICRLPNILAHAEEKTR